MPATNQRKSRQIRVAGVDGCPSGWLCVTRMHASGELTASIADSFSSLLDGPASDAAIIAVDMPIGLPDRPGRSCEKEARQILKKRSSSVFNSPLRGMLKLPSYEKANAYGKERGKGLSKQTWALIPKIREIDAIITPAMQMRVIESHPEIAFARLGGAPCMYAKRNKEGTAERVDILKRVGIHDLSRALAQLRTTYPTNRHFSDDDFLDAVALTFVAAAVNQDTARRLGDGARDSMGLEMAIWAPF